MDQFDESEISSTDVRDAGLSSPVTEEEELVTGPELDCWLRISPTTRWRWTKAGRLPVPFRLHPHGPNLYRKRAIRELIDSAPVVDIYQASAISPIKKQLRDA